MKTATLISAGFARRPVEEIRALEQSDQMPHILLYEETLNSDIIDEQFVYTMNPLNRYVYLKTDPAIAQVLRAYRNRRQYDAIISWGAKLGLLFASLLSVQNEHVPHLVLASWISTPKKAMVLKRVHPWIDRLILWSSIQKQFAIDELGIPESRIAFIRKGADPHFWHQLPVEQEIICSAGYEMRDYGTLVAALQGTGIRCHIAAGTYRDVGNGRVNKLVPAVLPPEVTVGRKNITEMRELYARSKFVVLPIHPTDTDHGLSCILESMAMSRAVICSRVRGQVDVLQDGVTGLFVPPHDPAALREAILYLNANPDVADRMGRAGRKLLEEKFTLNGFIQSMKTIVDETTAEHRARPIKKGFITRRMAEVKNN